MFLATLRVVVADLLCFALLPCCFALVLLLQKGGRIKWSSVAARLPGRTDKQCAIRWKTLTTG